MFQGYGNLQISALYQKCSPHWALKKTYAQFPWLLCSPRGLEWYARDFTMDVIEDLIDTHQYGSAKGSSTVLALVELVHCWLAALEPNRKVLRIHLVDFRKAFHRVDHKILLPKLANAGLPNFLIKWNTNFLCERKPYIKNWQYNIRMETNESRCLTGYSCGTCYLPYAYKWPQNRLWYDKICRWCHNVGGVWVHRGR